MFLVVREAVDAGDRVVVRGDRSSGRTSRPSGIRRSTNVPRLRCGSVRKSRWTFSPDRSASGRCPSLLAGRETPCPVLGRCAQPEARSGSCLGESSQRSPVGRRFGGRYRADRLEGERSLPRPPNGPRSGPASRRNIGPAANAVPPSATTPTPRSTETRPCRSQ